MIRAELQKWLDESNAEVRDVVFRGIFERYLHVCEKLAQPLSKDFDRFLEIGEHEVVVHQLNFRDPMFAEDHIIAGPLP